MTDSPKFRGRNALTNWAIITLVVVGGLVYIAHVRREQMAKAGTTAGMPLLTSDNIDGRIAPNWSLPTPEGTQLSLSAFKGHPVVLDFWATWCGPCREEIPIWEQLQKQYANKGLVIVGISEDDHKQDVLSFLKQTPLTYPVVMDQDRLSGSYGLATGLPTTLLVRKDGTIAERIEGLEDPGSLDRAVRGIL